MLNKKIELELGGVTYQLWFNNYAVCELQAMYGIEQKEIMERIVARASENYLLLISDLIKAGMRGHALAKEELTPKVNIRNLVADADMNKLIKVLEVFYDVMGVNIEKEPVDKKKATKKSVKVTS